MLRDPTDEVVCNLNIEWAAETACKKIDIETFQAHCRSLGVVDRWIKPGDDTPSQTPRRTGYPACAGYDGTCAARMSSILHPHQIKPLRRRDRAAGGAVFR